MAIITFTYKAELSDEEIKKLEETDKLGTFILGIRANGVPEHIRVIGHNYDTKITITVPETRYIEEERKEGFDSSAKW